MCLHEDTRLYSCGGQFDGWAPSTGFHSVPNVVARVRHRVLCLSREHISPFSFLSVLPLTLDCPRTTLNLKKPNNIFPYFPLDINSLVSAGGVIEILIRLLRCFVLLSDVLFWLMALSLIIRRSGQRLHKSIAFSVAAYRLSLHYLLIFLMNECLLRAVASRARLFKAKMQSVFSSHCWEHFRISLSISYQAFFHTHGAFLLGTVSENLSIVCQHVLIIKLDMKSTMSSFDSFKGVWISSVCCIGFALLWYILKRGFFLHLNSWKWKCVTYLQILLTDAVGWFKQPWKLLKPHSFPFIHQLPYLNVLFVFLFFSPPVTLPSISCTEVRQPRSVRQWGKCVLNSLIPKTDVSGPETAAPLLCECKCSEHPRKKNRTQWKNSQITSHNVLGGGT